MSTKSFNPHVLESKAQANGKYVKYILAVRFLIIRDIFQRFHLMDYHLA